LNTLSKQKTILIFIAPPGAGKGSLSHLLVKQHNWVQLSTGNLCREQIAQGTELGRQIDFIIKSGKLISDGIIIDLVRDWLMRNLAHAHGVILDGFPRTVAQAVALGTLLSEFANTQLKVVHLMVSDACVIQRLTERLICENKACQAVYSRQQKRDLICDECSKQLVRRTDDEKKAIVQRLAVYHEHEQQLLDFYKAHGYAIITMPADRSLEHVYDELISALGYAA
jgi:adenylate kinase